MISKPITITNKLGLGDVSVSVWVLFPLEIIVDSGLANGKDRESLHHITELS